MGSGDKVRLFLVGLLAIVEAGKEGTKILSCREQCKKSYGDLDFKGNVEMGMSGNKIQRSAFINCLFPCRRERRNVEIERQTFQGAAVGNRKKSRHARSSNSTMTTIVPMPDTTLPDFLKPQIPHPQEIGKVCGVPWTPSGKVPPLKTVAELRMTCEKNEDNSTDNTLVAYAQWFMPSNSMKDVVGFRVFYSMASSLDATLECLDVGKEMRSVRFTYGLNENDVVRLAVTPLPHYYKQNLNFTYFDCEKSFPSIPPVMKGNTLPLNKSVPPWAVVGGVTVGLVVLLTAIILAIKYGKKSHSFDTLRGKVTYFSHCFETEKEVEQLLTFAARLTTSYGIVCRIDLLEQRKIDKLTLAVWCNAQLAASDKIIIFFSERYCQAWQRHERSSTPGCTADDIEIQKILNDMCYIQQLLMESHDRTTKVICLLTEGVQRTDLPDFLRRRRVLTWPLDQEKEKDLVSCIIGQETRILEV